MHSNKLRTKLIKLKNDFKKMPNSKNVLTVLIAYIKGSLASEYPCVLSL